MSRAKTEGAVPVLWTETGLKDAWVEKEAPLWAAAYVSEYNIRRAMAAGESDVDATAFEAPAAEAADRAVLAFRARRGK